MHAELVRMGDAWVVCDDGLSHNGTFVNGERVRGRRRLAAGDIVQVGASTLAVGERERPATSPPTRRARRRRRDRAYGHARAAAAARGPVPPARAVPAPSNREIAAELGISLDTVKGTLTVLFERFGLARCRRTPSAPRSRCALTSQR